MVKIMNSTKPVSELSDDEIKSEVRKTYAGVAQVSSGNCCNPNASSKDLIVVVFPAPFGPRNANMECSGTSRLKSFMQRSHHSFLSALWLL